MKKQLALIALLTLVGLLTWPAPAPTTTATSWDIQTVDGAGDSGYHSSIATNALGYAHVSYYDGSENASLKYACYDGAQWHVQTVESNLGHIEPWGGGTSLALDSSLRPHIAYYDWTEQSLKYAHLDGACSDPGRGPSWQLETLDNSGLGKFGGQPSLALDSAGRPHIAYYDSPYSDLKYTYYDGAAWRTEIPDSSGLVGAYPSLALDSSGRPHISYYDNDHGDLRYAHYDGAGWLTQTVASAGDVGGYTSLALDSAGRPHISYCLYDPIDFFHCRQLQYAHYDGTGWLTQTVDSTGKVGEYSALALDSSDRPYISYYDYTSRDLKYAYVNSACLGPRQCWQVETVDSTGSVGQYTSLALDAFAYPHISYYDASSGELKYVHIPFTPQRYYMPLAMRSW